MRPVVLLNCARWSYITKSWSKEIFVNICTESYGGHVNIFSKTLAKIGLYIEGIPFMFLFDTGLIGYYANETIWRQ